MDKDQGEVSRHERSVCAPSLAVALSYEVVFQVPTSDLFPEIHDNVTHMIESRLAALEDELWKRSATDRGANVAAKKLTWLTERKG